MKKELIVYENKDFDTIISKEDNFQKKENNIFDELKENEFNECNKKRTKINLKYNEKLKNYNNIDSLKKNKETNENILKCNAGVTNESKGILFKKNINNFFRTTIIPKKLAHVLIKMFIMINLINPIYSKIIPENIRRLDSSSEITIKINTNGTQQILSEAFSSPDEVYLNGNLIGEHLYEVDLIELKNEIRMVWYDNGYTTCKNMFNFINKNNIIEMDLSKFDTSNVIDMEYMFGNCKFLKSINLKNLDTSLVENMNMMFYSCIRLESLDLSNFNTSSVKKMNNVFQECNEITSIDVSHFDTSSAITMRGMFSGCKKLTFLNLTNFITSFVTDMSNMFSDCNSLTSLDLSMINTSLVNSMSEMFFGCNSLTSLDLSNFETSSVTTMDSMFNKCNLLISLDLSSFDTSSVKSMFKMFADCNQLQSINLSSFNTEKVKTMGKMFQNCKSLEEINLSKFNVSLLQKAEYMFNYCTSLKSLDLSSFTENSITDADNMFSFCESLTSLNLANLNTSYVNKMSSMFSGCSSLLSLDLSSFMTSSLTITNFMFSNCTKLISINFGNFDTSEVTSMNNMFSDCQSLTSLNLSSFITSNVLSISQMFKNCYSLKSIDLSNFDTSNIITMYEMFSSCLELQFINISNFMISNTTFTTGMFSSTPENMVICFDESINSINKLIAEKKCPRIDCSSSWRENQSKINFVNNSCLEQCGGDNIFIYEYENKCYEECPNGTHPNNFLCETDIIESEQKYISENNINFLSSDVNSQEFKYEDYTKISEENEISQNIYSESESVENAEKIYCDGKEFFLNRCKLKIDDNKDKNEFLHNIINEIINGTMNEILELVVNDNQNIIIEENKDLYQISTLSNQMNKINYNYTSINIGKCERRLRDQYEIEDNKELIIFKIEYFVEGYNIPIINYVLFTEDGKIKLNLDYCKNLTIKYNIPVSINESELYKYEPGSDYYNDECFTHTTESSTDITLYDRKNAYNSNNLSLCEINCTYQGYNISNKKVECKCKVKSSFLFVLDFNIDRDKLLHKFVNFKSLVNFPVLKCYKLLFSKEGLISNVGSYILLTIISTIIIQSIFFCTKGYNSLLERMKKIIQINLNKNRGVIINLNNIKKSKIKNKKSKFITSLHSQTKKKEKKNLKKNKNKILPKSKQLAFIDNFSIKNNSIKNSFSTKNDFSKSNTFGKRTIIKISSLIERSKNNIKSKIIEYEKKDKTDYELNSLSYKDALIYDKRSYCQYYFSLLRTKHLIIFTFYTKSDYNSRIIKKCLFLFEFVLHYTINALFFNDSTMHQIYEDQGSFNFINQIPQIIYSSLISALIKKILNSLSLTEKIIINIKNQNTLNLAVTKMKKYLKEIKIKFTIFFIFSFLFLFLFWYYLSCFCAVYRNTQIYLIKDTLISFATSLLYPFIINLIPGIFRIPSLRYENNECLYKIGLIIQII